MSIYIQAPGQGPNIVQLMYWSIRESQDGTRRFVGYDVYADDGRVSSPIVELDVALRTGRTQTGRFYVLEGGAGYHRDAEYVFKKFVPYFGDGSPWRDVTADLIPDCQIVRDESADRK